MIAIKKIIGSFPIKIQEFLFSIVFFLVYIKISRLGSSIWISLPELLDGTALRPYIYRILLPQSAKLLSKIIPINIAPQSIQSKILGETFLALDGDTLPSVAFWILVLIFSSIVGFLWVERHFLADLGFSQETQNIIPFFLLFFSLPFTVYFGYLYDMPQLFLFTFSLWLLYKRKWMQYLVVFTLATLNKETSIFLSAVFLIYYVKKLDKKTFYSLLSLQVFLYLTIRFSLIWRFRNNPGDIIYPAFFEHVKEYKQHPILLLFTILLFSSVFFLVKKDWGNKNGFLKSATIVPVLILLLYFWGGMPMEFRVFLEALPILGVLIFNPEKLL